MSSPYQDSLFDEPVAPAPSPAAAPPSQADAAEAPESPVRRKRAEKRKAKVLPAPEARDWQALRNALPAGLYLGTSSWHFPGWKGMVWDDVYEQSVLSRHGLGAYAQHPLLRTVSLDRSFYRPLTATQFAGYAAQVPADFRFVVKAPSLICDALVRDENGHGMQPNPAFLDPALAAELFVQPAIEGLGERIGALVFQISPLPLRMLADIEGLIVRLGVFLQALPSLKEVAPHAVVAVEVRDGAWLQPAFAHALRDAGATYCIGLHPRLPPISEQLPVLRALWPGPLVCRWNLHRRHGAYGYGEAKDLYAPFDQIQDPDPQTRATLARVIVGTTGAGQPAYVCINNKAEGSAPLSVQALAEEVRRQMGE